jgi:uncharacterized membrane protein YkvA (DUF1232 family)
VSEVLEHLGLDDRLLVVVERLHAQQEAEPERLHLDDAIERKLADVVREAEARGEMDVELARRIGAACAGLLAHARTLGAPEHAAARRLCLVAVHYFVLWEDADRDVSPGLGFDDDLAVVNAIAAAVGRLDLVVPSR